MSILALAPLPVLIFVAGTAIVATCCTTTVAAHDVDADSDHGSEHRIIARTDNGSIDVDVRR